MTRSWGQWTSIKLDAVERYLSAFNRASTSVPRTMYLDLFAGSADNVARDSGITIEGSALRALAADPRFDKVIVSELELAAAASLRSRLEARYPDRDFSVLQGDCNVVVPEHLAGLDPSWRRAPTFAFLDQYAAEVSWSTMEFLANYRQHTQGWKMEQCVYFGDSFVLRGLHKKDGGKNHSFAERVDRMYGSRWWRQILAAREDRAISAETTRAELVNLLRWRMEHVLGYGSTTPLELVNNAGHPLYKLIFATDHPVGEKIMTQVFGVAQRDLREMVEGKKRQRAIERSIGDAADSLFDATQWVASTTGEPRYIPPLMPPLPPFEYHREWQ